MIVIADSGSSKCDWVLVNLKTGKRVETTTRGINPLFHDEIFISEEIFGNKILRQYGPKATHVFLYCAGGSSKEFQGKVARGLHIIFKDAAIKVSHDMDAAVYATCDGKPGIACILGTGSNSCYFDGKKIYEEIPSLGFILGDEGSGSYYGKILLREYFYKMMPPKIQAAFEKAYHPKAEEAFKRVYQKPHANVYLASFMKFCSQHRKEQYILDIVDDGMIDFLVKHVRCYHNYREVPVHFVGSIAYYFEDILRKHCKNLDIKVGTITNKPVNGLVKYHLQKDFGIGIKKGSASAKKTPRKSQKN